MEIKRDYYLNKLISRKGNGLIKIITGVRRCGKSYLLNTIFYRHLLECGVPEDHIIRFAFDSADDLYLIGESLIDMRKAGRGATRVGGGTFAPRRVRPRPLPVRRPAGTRRDRFALLDAPHAPAGGGLE